MLRWQASGNLVPSTLALNVLADCAKAVGLGRARVCGNNHSSRRKLEPLRVIFRSLYSEALCHARICLA